MSRAHTMCAFPSPHGRPTERNIIVTIKKGLHRNTPNVVRIMYALKDELGRYTSGDRFFITHGDRTDQAVADAYAVSQDVARFALQLLVEEGLLEVRPGHGFFVN